MLIGWDGGIDVVDRQVHGPELSLQLSNGSLEKSGTIDPERLPRIILARRIDARRAGDNLAQSRVDRCRRHRQDRTCWRDEVLTRLLQGPQQTLTNGVPRQLVEAVSLGASPRKRPAGVIE